MREHRPQNVNWDFVRGALYENARLYAIAALSGAALNKRLKNETIRRYANATLRVLDADPKEEQKVLRAEVKAFEEFVRVSIAKLRSKKSVSR